MKVKTMKILVTIATILLVISMGIMPIFAAQVEGPSGIKVDVDNAAQTNIRDIGGRILGIAQTVGVVLAVLILTVLGIKYMMGSAEEKADYKKTMIPYLVGAVFIFAAPAIANMVYNFVISINP